MFISWQLLFHISCVSSYISICIILHENCTISVLSDCSSLSKDQKLRAVEDALRVLSAGNSHPINVQSNEFSASDLII